MPDDLQSLLKAVEDGYFLLPEDGKRIRTFAFENVHGLITDFDHEDINMVRCLPGFGNIEESTIDRVLDLYRDAGVPCCWIVTPLSPPGLADALRARGFKFNLSDLAMITTDFDRIIRDVEGVTVKPAGRDDKNAFTHVLSESFEEPLEMWEYVFDLVWRRDKKLDVRMYLAWRDGVEEPVGAAASLRLPDSKLLLLEAAGVLKEHRKKGVYIAMVSERVRYARDTGAEGVVIQAIVETSAPVCAKMGFKELGRHDFYVWRPGGPNKPE